jgi:16S rRNA (uracil1498-N3)-methyltransferase
MELFYSQPKSQLEHILTDQEAIHCARVKRHKVGDTIFITDGAGCIYSALITSISSKEVLLKLIDTISSEHNRDYELIMAVALTKNIDRFEWFLEKSVEIGVSRIIPLVCERSERRVVNQSRGEKIVVSAMKQSLKSVLPIYSSLTTFKELMDEFSNAENICKMVAHCNDGHKNDIKSTIKSTISEGVNRFLVLIGPEGDFSPNEIELAIQSGFLPVSLGPSRLRTETAALTAVSALYINYL